MQYLLFDPIIHIEKLDDIFYFITIWRWCHDIIFLFLVFEQLSQVTVFIFFNWSFFRAISFTLFRNRLSPSLHLSPTNHTIFIRISLFYYRFFSERDFFYHFVFFILGFLIFLFLFIRVHSIIKLIFWIQHIIRILIFTKIFFCNFF